MFERIKPLVPYILLTIAIVLLATATYYVGAVKNANDNAIKAQVQNIDALVQAINSKASVQDIRLLCSLTPACVQYVQSQIKK